MMNGMDGDSHDSLFESCDAISHELMMMYSILFDEEGEPKDPSLEECLQGDIMYLDSIEIEPSFRGYGIGLLAFDGLRGIFPSFEMDVILLNPAGLTSELEKNPGSSAEATQNKLIVYWSLLGMTVWAPAQSDFKLMGMWTGLRLPRIEEVCLFLLNFCCVGHETNFASGCSASFRVNVQDRNEPAKCTYELCVENSESRSNSLELNMATKL
ncbi:hypothetical protein B0H10DRAFT_2084692, partial [Mycena sp. CBHHK59/15]